MADGRKLPMCKLLYNAVCLILQRGDQSRLGAKDKTKDWPEETEKASLRTPSSFQRQDICTCCSLCLARSSLHPPRAGPNVLPSCHGPPPANAIIPRDPRSTTKSLPQPQPSWGKFTCKGVTSNDIKTVQWGKKCMKIENHISRELYISKLY